MEPGAGYQNPVQDRYGGFEKRSVHVKRKVYWDGLYPNRFIVENKKAKCTWVYPMKIS